jgi:uncharacterized metal-binding protein YceD (DUF177 family)
MLTRLQAHRAHIPHDGSVQVAGDLDPAILNLEDTEWTAKSPIRFSVEISLSGGDIYGLGYAALDLTATCVKCLEEFSSALEIPDLALHKEADGRELVDLTDELREDILLILPSHPRCDVDGNRECSATFRTGPQAPLADELVARPEAWNALDQFKSNQ